MEEKLIREMIEDWRSEFLLIREQLAAKGGESNSLEYNILATEALRLSLCINDATDLLLSITQSRINKRLEDQANKVMRDNGHIPQVTMI